jgi:hypothetical protein
LFVRAVNRLVSRSITASTATSGRTSVRSTGRTVGRTHGRKCMTVHSVVGDVGGDVMVARQQSVLLRMTTFGQQLKLSQQLARGRFADYVSADSRIVSVCNAMLSG